MIKKLIIVVLFVVGLGTVYSFTAKALGLPSPTDLLNELTS